MELGRARIAKLALVVAFAAAFAPLLFAVLDEARFGGCRPLSYGDEAMLEIHLRQAVRGRHLLGAYSQYGWYHPGPLYYYLLAPFYALSGGQSRGMNVGVAVLNLGAIAGMVALHLKAEKGTLGRLLGALVIAAFCSALATRVPEGALVTNPLIEIWNPLVTVLPFGLLIFVCAAVALGRVELLPLAAFLHAFTIQTHVSFGPPSTLLVVAAAAWMTWQRAAPRERRVRALVISGALALLLWLPPLIALLLRQQGNAWEILQFALAEKRRKIPPLEALAYGVRQIHAPLLYWLRFEEGQGTALSFVLSGVELGVSVVCLTSAARRARPYPAALAAATILLTLVASAQSQTLLDLNEHSKYYQTLWFGIAGCLGWYTLPYALAVLLRGRGIALNRVGWLVYPAGAWTLAAFALRAVSRDYERCVERTPSRPEPAETAMSVLVPLFDPKRHPEQRYVADTSDAGPGLPTVMLTLEKHGVEPLVSRDWNTRVGNGAHYGYEDQPAVHVSKRPDHDYPLWRGLGTVGVYVEGLGQRPPGEMPALRCELVSSEGDVERPKRGARRPHGRGKRRRKPPPAERALDAKAPITVHVAGDVPELGFIQGLRLKTTARTEYEVTGSTDGKTFIPIGVSPGRRMGGAAWRSFYFNDGVGWPFVRLTADDTEPVILDVKPLVAEGRLLDVTAMDASGTVEVSLTEGQSYDLTLLLRARQEPEARRTLRLSCNDRQLGEVALSPRVLEYRTFVVPSACTAAKTTLHFELADPEGLGSDVRHAIAFEGGWLMPTELSP